MSNGRRNGSRTRVRKHWLAGGVMAAGLGAAMITGAATASAGADADTSPSTSATATADGTVRAGTATDDTAPDDTTEDSTDGAADESDVEDEAADEADVEDEAAEDDVEDEDTEDSADDDAAEELDETPVDVPPAEPADQDPQDGTGTGAATPDEAPRADATDEARRDRAGGRVSPAPAESAEPAVEVVTLRTAAAAVEVDPVLVAAATSTEVTWGSMIVDLLYSIGIRSKKMGTDWLAIPVSKAAQARWLVRRSLIYRNVVIPQPNPPSHPKPLWETNFSSMEEALRYWGLQTGRWGQSAGENQYYTDGDNVYIDADGNLVIEARREATPDRLGAPHNYTSARVVTMGKQSIGVGTRVVARIQMPVTKGVLPAFWSVGLEPGHEYDWPRQGEIDIVEIPGMGTPDSRSTWTGNVHGPAAGNNGIDVKLHGVDADLGVDLSQGFHDYGMDWHADRIIWHVDGVEVGRITKVQYEALGGDWTPFSGAWEHYLILNVAVGNPWTGDPSPTAPFQAQMKVDWVKAYAL